LQLYVDVHVAWLTYLNYPTESRIMLFEVEQGVNQK